MTENPAQIATPSRDTPAELSEGELKGRLEQFIAEKLPRASSLRFARFDRMIEGWSWETYVIDAEWNESGRTRAGGFVIRRVPRAGLLLTYDTLAQWEIHRAVEAARVVPIPKLLWIEPEGTVAGRPFYVMEKVEGVVPVPWKARSFFPNDEVRHDVGRQLARVLGLVHTIPLRDLPLDRLRGARDPAQTGLTEIAYWREIYEDYARVRVPILEVAFNWLERNAGDVSGRLSLVHTDLRTGNFIMQDDKIVSVLDWEMAHLSDPIEDLANTTTKFFRGNSPDVSQLLPMDEFLKTYEEVVGWQVPEKAHDFWTLYILVRGSITHITASRLFEDGRTDDVRYANMGHQMYYTIRWLAEAIADRKLQ
jgi:aminoglycoside phosphotransferase (APT) family kinase protein